MQTRAAIFLPGLALLLSGCALWYNAPLVPPLVPGQRVRVTIPSVGMKQQVATLAALSADTIVLRDVVPGDSMRWATPLSGVSYFERSRGVHSAAGAGAAIGGVAGGVFGYIAVKQSRDACNKATYGYWPFCALEEPVYGFFAGSLVGAGMGAVVGLFIRSERWEHIPLALLRRLHVELSPQVGGSLGLGVSLAF